MGQGPTEDGAVGANPAAWPTRRPLGERRGELRSY